MTFAGPIFAEEYDVSFTYVTYRSDGNGRVKPVYIVRTDNLVEYKLDNCETYWCGTPAVSDEDVVYKTAPHEDDTLQIIWQYRIGDEARYPLIQRRMTERSRSVALLDLSGDVTAWYDSAIAPAGLYAMDITDGVVINLTTDRCVCYEHPTLWSRQVVYEGWQVGFSNVYLVDIDNLESRNLTFEEQEATGTLTPQTWPRFDGNRVVWTDSRNDPSHDPVGQPFNADIYGMELPDGPQEPLCTHPANQWRSDVHGGLVAWEDFRNAEDPNDRDRDQNIDIYLLDLSTGQEQQVTDLPGSERNPRIWGRRLFFVARDLLDQDAVFMVDLVEAGLL